MNANHSPPAQQESQVSEGADDKDRQIRELTRWTLRLSAALRIGLPRSRYPDEAMHYLEDNGLVVRPAGVRARSFATQPSGGVQ